MTERLFSNRELRKLLVPLVIEQLLTMLAVIVSQYLGNFKNILYFYAQTNYNKSVKVR